MTNEELVRRYYDGDEAALEKLYHKNLGLIRSIAKETAADFSCLTVDEHHPNQFSAYTKTVLDDLCGEGVLEFLTRIQSREYDESRAALTTYLYPHLRGRMTRWLEQNLGCMTLSKDEMAAVRQAQRLYHVAWKDTGEIAEELGVSEARVSRYVRYNTHFLGVHDLVPESYDGDPYERLMPGMLSVSAEQAVYRKVCIELLRELFDTLPKKDRDILGKTCDVFGYLNIVGPAKNDTDKYEFSFLTEGEAENDNEHYWFAVGNILNMPELGDVMRYLMSNIVYSYSKEQAEFANNALGALYKAVHEQRSISYYKVKNEQLDTVLQIFIRVNSGGTILSYSDLLLSIASAQWKELDARKEITDFVDEINSIGYGFNVNKDFVLKASLVLSDFRDIAFKVDNFNKTNMLKIEQNWQTIIKSVALAFQLVASFGFSRENLTSNNAVIPIAYYLMTIGNPPSFVTSTSTTSNRIKIKKWLSLALLKKAFSGQPDSILRPIREIIKKNGKNDFPIDEIVDELRGGNKTLIFTDDDIENLLDRKYGQPDTRTILMFLYPSLD